MAIEWFAPMTAIIAGIALFAIGKGMLFKVRRKDMFKGIGSVLIGLGLVGMFVIPVSDLRNLAPEGSLDIVGGDSEEVSTGSCPDDDETDLYLKAEDIEASTKTYVTSTYYLYNDDLFVNATTSTAGYATALAVPCGDSYTLAGVTTADGGTGYAQELTLSGSKEYESVDTHQISPMQLRIKDLNNDTYMQISEDALASGDNATSYQQLNNSFAGWDTGVVDTTVGSDGSIDLEIYVKTETSNKFGGDEAIYLLVDVGSDNEWQEPDVGFEGVGLSDVKDQLVSLYPDSSTYSKVSNSEYAYKLGDGKSIGDTAKTISYYNKARSGQDPDATNDDIVLCILGVGSYLSSEDADLIEHGIATDASTQVLVTHSSTTPCITFGIA